MKTKPRKIKLVLPRQYRRIWSALAFVEQLPDVALSVAESRFGANARVVLNNYMLKGSSQKTSLSGIGRTVGITRQAAHAIFKRMIRKFSEIMLEDNYRMCGFRLRPEFVRPLQVLYRKLDSKTILIQNDWNRVLAKSWGVKASELGAMEPFILEILGLRRLDFCESTLKPIIVRADYKNKTCLNGAVYLIRDLLKSRYPGGLTFNQLSDAINAHPRLSRLGSDALRVLVRSMKHIEKVGGRYRIRDRSMRRGADRFEQILQAARKPLHYSELARRAQRFGYRGNLALRQSVANILVKDPRFTPVPNRGFWALSDWKHVETRTITQIAFDEIERAGHPLDENQLYRLIAKHRMVKKRSIRRMLTESSQFEMIGPKLWMTRRNATGPTRYAR